MREPAVARLSRLLALVPWLEQHQGVSIVEAAAHFGVSPQELERDLWLTVCCGLPGHGPDQLVDIQFWDEDGAIHVIDAQTLDRPLRLSSAEATSLLVGLRLLAQVPGDHDRAALASATAKLEAAAGAGQGATVLVDDHHDDRLATLREAAQRGCAVRMVYAGASRDEITERIVEPGPVVHHGGQAYLSAWCRLAGAERTFRVDRIVSVEAVDELVGTRDVTPIIEPRSGVVVRLRVEPRSRWILETLDATGRVDLGEGREEATIVVAEPPWLVRMVLAQGGGVEVIEPEDLRREVRDAAREALGRIGP